MTYRITTIAEQEIDAAFEQRDTARANARRLKNELGEALVRENNLRAALRDAVDMVTQIARGGSLHMATFEKLCALANEQEGK